MHLGTNERKYWFWMPPSPKASARDIIAEVAERHGLTVDELREPDRTRHRAWARQEAAWMLRQATTLSTTAIARKLGLLCHTTVLHSVRAHQARLDARLALP